MDKQKVVPHPVQLREVITEKINCKRTGGYKPDISLRVDFGLKAKTINSKQAYAYLKIKIYFDEEPQIFSLEIVVRGKLENENSTSRAKMKQFAEKQSLPLLLPWAREEVASLTRRMGFPPLLLPLIDVYETIRINDCAADEKPEG